MLVNLRELLANGFFDCDEAGDDGAGGGGGEGDPEGDDPEGDDSDDSTDDDTEVTIKDPKALLAKHRKIERENRRLKADAATRQKEIDAERTKKLKASEDYKALADDAEARALAAETKANAATERLVYLSKVSAFKAALGAGVVLDNKFVHLIPDDEIGYDEETGISAADLSKAVKDFKKTYPEVLKTPGVKGLPPSDAPPSGGASGPLSAEEYKNMSLSDKKKNYSRMIAGLSASN